MTSTHMASGMPVPQRMYEMMRVQRACCGLGRTEATIPPEAEATMGATMGRSQAAVMVWSVAWWMYMLPNVSFETAVGKRGKVHYEGHIETTCKRESDVNPP